MTEIPVVTTRAEPTLLPADPENLAGKTDEQLGRAHVSHTQISVWLRCRQLWAYQYVDQIEPVTRPRALSMGAAFHRGIEARNPQVAYDTLYEGARMLTDTDPGNTEIDARTAQAACRLYLELYPDLEAQREWEYRVPIRNPDTGEQHPTLDLLGYADQLVDGKDGLTLIENKLVGQVTNQQVQRLALDRQVSLACYGIWRATGRRVTRVLYRWTRKPSIRQRKNETPGDFARRLEGDYMERPDFYATEEVTHRTETDLAVVEQELWQWANEIEQARIAGFYPRNTSSCADYGGCPFVPLCARQDGAENLYRHKTNNQKEGA